MLGIDFSLSLYNVSFFGFLVSKMLVWEVIWERWMARWCVWIGVFYFEVKRGRFDTICSPPLHNARDDAISVVLYIQLFLLFSASHLSFEILPPVLLCLASKVIT